MMKTFILLNDTRVDSHMGCRVVSSRIVDEMSKRGYRHIASMNHGPDFEPCLAKGPNEHPSLVVLNGEGTMHDDAARGIEMLSFAKIMRDRGSRVVLVNSIWQNNSAAYNNFLPIFDAIYVREPYSAAELEKVGVHAEVCPDIVLSNDPKDIFRSSAADFLKMKVGALLDGGPKPIVTDCAVPSNTERLKKIARNLQSHMHLMGSQTGRESHDGITYSEMNERSFMRPNTFLIGGRFHACCFAIMAKIPFLYLSSNTHKIEGTLDWFGINPDEVRLPGGTENWSARDFSRYIAGIDAFKPEAFRMRSRKLANIREMTRAMFDIVATS